MRILLVYPKAKIWNMPKQIPLGLAYLGAVLQRAGHSVEVFDTATELGKLSGKLKKGNFDLVGISATTPLIKDAWKIAAIVKKHSRARVVIGGAHPSAMPEESLKYPFVDFVIRGEGERAILELCQYLSHQKKREEIAGLSFKKGKKIVHNPPSMLNKNLDALPFPAYHLFKIERYGITQPLRDRQTKNSRAFYIMTSRGCPYSCVYCFKGVCGRTWRPISPKRVIEEWSYLIHDLKATEIGVQDDLFNLDRERAMEICDLLIEKRLNHIPWITNNGIRADRIDLKLLKKMKAAGCKRVAFGVESGSQKILNNIQKQLTLAEVRKAFVMAKTAGLETMGFFMFGNPGETEESMEQTIRFAIELNPDVAHFSIATPFPGAPLYELVKSAGELVSTDWNDYGILEGRGFFNLGEVSPELVERKWREAYRRFYLRPKRLWKEMLRKDSWLNLKLLLKAGRRYFT